jgi:hypothetical protein
MGYALEGWSSIPGTVKIFSFLHSIKIGSGFHLASHPMGSRGSLLEGEVAGA